MFDFEKLDVYVLAKKMATDTAKFLKNSKVSTNATDQLNRAALSVVLNISEGTGRATNPDKRRFYTIARASLYECAAVYDYLKDLELVPLDFHKVIYRLLERISILLLRLIHATS